MKTKNMENAEKLVNTILEHTVTREYWSTKEIKMAGRLMMKVLHKRLFTPGPIGDVTEARIREWLISYDLSHQ